MADKVFARKDGSDSLGEVGAPGGICFDAHVSLWLCFSREACVLRVRPCRSNARTRTVV